MSANYGLVPGTYVNKFKPLGITLVALGSCSIVVAIATIALLLSSTVTNDANEPGIYVGIVGIVTGSMSIKTSKEASNCSVITGIVFGALLMPGSLYMMYFEGAGSTATASLGLHGLTATYSLNLICGIGMFLTGIIYLVYSAKTLLA